MNDDCRVTLVSLTLRLRLQTVRQVDNAEIFRFTKFEVHCILPDDQRLRRLPLIKRAASIYLSSPTATTTMTTTTTAIETMTINTTTTKTRTIKTMAIKTTTITPPGDATILATTTSWRRMEALPPPSDDDHG